MKKRTMECKECYHCHQSKPLEEYDKTYKKSARAEQLGYCIGCKDCTTEEAAEERRLGKYPANRRWVKFIPKAKKKAILDNG